MVSGKCIGIDARMIEMSGIGTYIQHLMGQGIYDVAVGNEEEIRKYDKNVKVIPFDAPIYGIKEQLTFPNRAISESGVEIMHFPHYNVPIKYRGKYVVTVHDLTHIVLPEFLGNKMKFYYAKFLMNHAIKKSSHIFTVSKNSKNDIMRYFGVKDEKISVTYNAIDDDFRVKNFSEYNYLLKKYSIPSNKKTVLYVGNLKPHKNLQTLLKAIKKIDSDDIILILAGKAFKSEDLGKKEKELGIYGQVIHTGMVSKEELIDLYNFADVFVFPSLYEGFGIPPLEAMACGTPVIAANNSSIPEVCGDAAILVDGKDADSIAASIMNLVSENDITEAMIKKGLQRVNDFSWKKTVVITKKYIEECLK